MSWSSAYNGDWSGHPGNEMIPILLALCNAVGDRFEACGRNRPSWPVVSGTKSATLETADLAGLDLHRYAWFNLVADGIEDLIDGGGAGGAYCRGFVPNTSSDGLSADRLTVAGLEATIGLGGLRDKQFPDHSLFDETYANRLREFLDRLLYTVCVPSASSTLATRYFGNGSSADAAWGALAVSGTPSTPLYAEVTGLAGAPIPYSAVLFNSITVTLNCGNTQNLSGFQGSIARQLFPISATYTAVDSMSVSMHGLSHAIAGSGTDAVTLEGGSSLNLTGTTNVSLLFSGIGGGSPFNGVSSPLTGLGNATASAAVGTFADNTARLILDLSGILGDRT